MSIWAGKQKAVVSAIGTFAALFIVTLTSGGDVAGLASAPEAHAVYGLIGDIAISAAGAGVTYALGYFKTNVAADGTVMQFVKPPMTPGSPATVVDANGQTKGTLAPVATFTGNQFTPPKGN